MMVAPLMPKQSMAKNKPHFFIMSKLPPTLLLLGMIPCLTMCQTWTDHLLAIDSVQQNSQSVEHLLDQGKETMKLGEYGKAITEFEVILDYYKLSPQAPEALLLIGRCEEANNNPRDAFDRYQKLIENYPQSPLYTQAIDSQFRMASDAASGKIKGKMFWGLWEVTMDSTVVIKWMSTVIQNAPYDSKAPDAAMDLANYFISRDEELKAIAALSALVEKYPSSKLAPTAQLKLAELWASSASRGKESLVNLGRAQECFEEYTLLYPDSKDKAKVQARIRDMKSLMVNEQLRLATFYLERSKEYSSAIFMLEDVIRQEKINPEAAATARKLLPEAQMLLQKSFSN